MLCSLAVLLLAFYYTLHRLYRKIVASFVSATAKDVAVFNNYTNPSEFETNVVLELARRGWRVLLVGGDSDADSEHLHAATLQGALDLIKKKHFKLALFVNTAAVPKDDDKAAAAWFGGQKISAEALQWHAKVQQVLTDTKTVFEFATKPPFCLQNTFRKAADRCDAEADAMFAAAIAEHEARRSTTVLTRRNSVEADWTAPDFASHALDAMFCGAATVKTKSRYQKAYENTLRGTAKAVKQLMSKGRPKQQRDNTELWQRLKAEIKLKKKN